MIEFLLGLSPGLMVAAIVIAFIALVSQMSLYAKAGQPAISALVPGWNVIVFCKVVGRPAKHALWLILPGVVIASVIAFDWKLIDGLFPIHGEEGFLPGPTKWSEVTVPFAIIGAAMLPLMYIVIVMFTEVCDSFGKHSTLDKVLCVLLNGAYILFVLGISDAKYESPWWSRKRGLPYYMPDFKHKGKKYLVTPDGPIIGDPREQKVKVEIVDAEVADHYDATTAAKEHITTLTPEEEAAEKVKSEAEEKVKKEAESKAKAEVPKKEEKVELKKEASMVEKPKVETPKTEVPKTEVPKVETPKVEAKAVATKPVETPKVMPQKTANPSEVEQIKAKAKKDALAAGISKKNWREEMEEKYKKK